MSCSLQRKLLCSLDTSALAAALTVSDGATLPSCAAFGSANDTPSGAPWTVRRLALLALRSTTGALLDSSPASSRRRYTTGLCNPGSARGGRHLAGARRHRTNGCT